MTADERRNKFRVGLSILYLPYYDALCLELGDHWQPYAGLRSFVAQDQLYAQGRTKEPLGAGHQVTNAKGGYSAHNYGCGTDWTWFDGDALMWLKKEAPAWAEYRAAVEKVGLRWGGEFGDVDHNEIKLSCAWPHIYQQFVQGGMTAAQQHIQSNCVGVLPAAPVK